MLRVGARGRGMGPKRVVLGWNYGRGLKLLIMMGEFFRLGRNLEDGADCFKGIREMDHFDPVTVRSFLRIFELYRF